VARLAAPRRKPSCMLRPLFDRLRSAYRSVPPVGPWDVLSIACWSGLVFGLAESVGAIIRLRVSHLPVGEHTWSELLWMPPLAATIGLVAASLLVILTDRVIRARGVLLRFAPAGMVCVGVYGALLAARLGVSRSAAALFALGCVVFVLRMPATFIGRVRRSPRLHLPLVMSLLVSVAVGANLLRPLTEWRARRTLPPSNAGAPNVLLIIWDTARALSMSLYGHTRKTTPELEEFAKRGVVFEHAFASSAWSLPSHASMYTGRYPHELSVGRTLPLDESYPTLAEALAHHGYVTAGFTGNLFYGSREFGIARGFSWYDDRAKITPKQVASSWSMMRRVIDRWLSYKNDHRSTVRRSAPEVTENLLEWIDRRGSRPFFASVNYFDAHAPYRAPAPFNTAFSAQPPRYWWAEPALATDPKFFDDLRTAYETCILYLDSELARLLAALRQRDVLDNTLIIITSDHGEQFGLHGKHLLAHERSMYSTVLRVPLVMVLPRRVPAGVRAADAVSIRDIPTTVMDVLGIASEEPFPGVSLLRVATGTDEQSEPRLAHLRPNKVWPKPQLDWAIRQSHVYSLMSGTLHYLVDASGEEELYDFVRDPWEKTDLSRDRTMLTTLTRFRAMLDTRAPGWKQMSSDTIAH
ncbi:MAG: sulfatase-like hydrolase/transferase, partial [Gemmatimonadaceae bacterium]